VRVSWEAVVFIASSFFIQEKQKTAEYYSFKICIGSPAFYGANICNRTETFRPLITQSLVFLAIFIFIYTIYIEVLEGLYL
jgi:hypothetical protein